MKVLQINCVYNKGSTGKITYDIHKTLIGAGEESVVCYGRGERVKEPGVYKTCGELYAKMNNLLTRLTGVMYGGCAGSTRKLIRIIKKEKPDIVHLQCINGYFVNIYQLLSWLKEQRLETILTLHAEFMYTANCAYAMDCEKWKSGCGNCPRFRQETKSIFWDRTAQSYCRMQAAFEDFHNLTVVSVSPWLMNRAQQSPMLVDKRHRVILNGVDTEIFRPCAADDIREKYGLKDEKVIFHVTPSFSDDPAHIKGGYYVLKLAEMLRDENIRIIVAGQYDRNIPVPENVIMLGQIRDQQELARYYSVADVTLLTSKKETFSMVTAESLCCGTPVVGFKAGAPEQIAISAYSQFVDWGDMIMLKQSVTDTLNNAGNRREIADMAQRQYAKHTMVRQYHMLYLEQTKYE